MIGLFVKILKRILVFIFVTPIFLWYYLSRLCHISFKSFAKSISIINIINIHPYQLINHKRYCATHKTSSYHIVQSERVVYTSEVIYGDDIPKPLIPFKTDDLFYAIHANVKIKGNSNFVFDSDKLVMSDFGFEMDHKFVNIDGALLRQYRDLALLKYKYRGRSVEKGIMLSGNFSYNYYHVIYEILIKLLLIDKCNIPTDVPIIVDDCILKVAQYAQLLNLLNKNNRSIIKIAKNEVIEVMELYYISPVNFIPPHVKNIHSINKFDLFFDPAYILQLRDIALKNMSSEKYPKRIFISRKHSKNRSYNEDEIWLLLEKYGFEKIAPETYSLAEQIAIFNGAKYIVAASGAALSNLLFCNNECKVICVQSMKVDIPVFAAIANTVDVEMRYCTGRINGIDIGRVHSGFKIDASELEKLLILSL